MIPFSKYSIVQWFLIWTTFYRSFTVQNAWKHCYALFCKCHRKIFCSPMFSWTHHNLWWVSRIIIFIFQRIIKYSMLNTQCSMFNAQCVGRRKPGVCLLNILHPAYQLKSYAMYVNEFNFRIFLQEFPQLGNINVHAPRIEVTIVVPDLFQRHTPVKYFIDVIAQQM